MKAINWKKMMKENRSLMASWGWRCAGHLQDDALSKRPHNLSFNRPHFWALMALRKRSAMAAKGKITCRRNHIPFLFSFIREAIRTLWKKIWNGSDAGKWWSPGRALRLWSAARCSSSIKSKARRRRSPFLSWALRRAKCWPRMASWWCRPTHALRELKEALKASKERLFLDPVLIIIWCP